MVYILSGIVLFALGFYVRTPGGAKMLNGLFKGTPPFSVTTLTNVCFIGGVVCGVLGLVSFLIAYSGWIIVGGAVVVVYMLITKKIKF